jgi:opacity protein-like surface antigen
MHKTLGVLAALLVCAAPVRAQRAHIGPHAGYDFDRNVALAGGQMSLPLSRYVELYPSVDAYFVSVGSVVGFNGDLKLRLAPGQPLQLYVGGGVNMLRTHAGSTSTTDTGWDLLAGLETRLGYSHPYVEGRMLDHDRSTFQLIGGINITLF